MIITNAFSMSMLDTHSAKYLRVEELSVNQASIMACTAHTDGNLTTVVGSRTLAAIFAGQLDVPLECQRVALKLNPCRGEEVEMLFGQYRGPRLTGAEDELPEGGSITWYRIEIRA